MESDLNGAIFLKTNTSKCKVCNVGSVAPVKNDKDRDKMIIYTRDGTLYATHVESRCNNRSLPCRAGHYYGYVTLGESGNVDKPRCYEKYALKNEYLVTSNQTAFAIDYLWDCELQLVFSNASFESLSKVYNNLHFSNLPTDVMQYRVEMHRKRLTEAVFIFAFLELGQRYGIPPMIVGGIDNTILKNRTKIRDKFREIWTYQHSCDVKGCSSVLIVDGGMKPTRPLCAAKLQGIKQFSQAGMSVVCGCLNCPQPSSKFCGEHFNLNSPVMTSDVVSEVTRKELRNHRTKTANFKDSQQDNIYVVESLTEKNGDEWKVKWLGFPTECSTWEKSSNLQPWIMTYYAEDMTRLGKPLPEPSIKYTKRSGNETYFYLTWGEERLQGNPWKGESFFSLASNDGEIVTQIDDEKSCNTKKTKDKRERRHTVGIMVGTKPCGTVVLFEELYGAESLTQVYGILVEYLSRLPNAARDALENILYDDACHLKKFSEDPKRAALNEFTQQLAKIQKHVDNFHFKVCNCKAQS